MAKKIISKYYDDDGVYDYDCDDNYDDQGGEGNQHNSDEDDDHGDGRHDDHNGGEDDGSLKMYKLSIPKTDPPPFKSRSGFFMRLRLPQWSVVRIRS